MNCEILKSNEMEKGKRVSFIVLVIVLIFAFYHLFLSDFLAYQRVKTQRTMKACDDYIEKYYDGYYLEDVRFLAVDISKSFVKLREFKSTYPKSEYMHQINEINKSIWAQESDRYLSQISRLSNPQAVDYFKALLNYLSKHDIYTLTIGILSDVSLKDFDEYDNSIRQLFEIVYEHPVEENMLPLGQNFSSGNIDNLEEMIVNALQKSFDAVFSEGFLEIVRDKDAFNKSKEAPIMFIKYAIKNQTDKDFEQAPHIWEYQRDGDFLAYILGISIDFNFVSQIPNENIGYSFTKHYDPTENFTFTGGLPNGYAIMTSMVFQKFTEHVAKDFSLPAQVADSTAKALALDFLY